MTYLTDTAQIAYLGKTTGSTKLYSALDFLARLVVQIPAPREQMVRYYGFYSNKVRGQRKKAACPDDAELEVLPAKKLSSKAWARLIAKVYLADPLLCPKCNGQMKVIAFIEQDDVIYKILRHLGLLECLRERPVAHAPSVDFEEYYAEEHSQLLPVEYEYEAC